MRKRSIAHRDDLQKLDLILCDVMMPEMDGYAVLQALHEDAALTPIPFIFLTAKGEKDDLRSGMNLGADDYLTKPVVREWWRYPSWSCPDLLPGGLVLLAFQCLTCRT